jgi:hypothetical protein
MGTLEGNGRGLDTKQQLLQRLCDAAIQSPSVPFSTQRSEERRMMCMLQRSERLSSASTYLHHEQPFVLGRWQHQVVPAGGVQKQMYQSARKHSSPTGTGLSNQAIQHCYSRVVCTQDCGTLQAAAHVEPTPGIC